MRLVARGLFAVLVISVSVNMGVVVSVIMTANVRLVLVINISIILLLCWSVGVVRASSAKSTRVKQVCIIPDVN